VTSFKAGTRGDRKRREIAHAIKRDNPRMPTAKKFRIATAAAKKKLK
jgi:hypothetical protein